MQDDQLPVSCPRCCGVQLRTISKTPKRTMYACCDCDNYFFATGNMAASTLLKADPEIMVPTK